MGWFIPRTMHIRRMITATTALEADERLNLFIRIPNTMDAKMNSMDMLAAMPFVRFWDGSGVVPSNVSAAMDANADIKRMSVR